MISYGRAISFVFIAGMSMLLASCIGSSKPKLLWSFKGKGWASTTPFFHKDKIYYQSFSGVVFCLNARTGESLWEFRTGGMGGSGPIVVDEDLLVVGSGSKNIFGLELDTGKELWRCPTKGPVMADGLVHEGLYYTTAWAGAIVAVDLKSGKPVNFGDGKSGRLFNESTPAVGFQGIYVSGDKGGPFLLAFDLEGGYERWRSPIGERGSVSPVYADNTVYFGDRAGRVKALSAALGRELWSAPVPGDVQFAPIVEGETLFVPSIDGYVLAFNRETGKELWRYKDEKAVGGGLCCDGTTVVFGSTSSFICGLSASSGSLLWKFKTGSSVEGKAIIHNGIVYMGDTDNNMYALKLP